MSAHQFKFNLVFYFCLTLVSSSVYGTVLPVKIIPQPAKVEVRSGIFKLLSSTVIKGTCNASNDVASFFATMLKSPTGYTFKSTGSGKSTIELSLNTKPVSELNKEGYILAISPSRISILANEPAGLFYGMQTLMQMLPEEIESGSTVVRDWSIPCAQIIDYPRFSWRGLMLDVSRHFFSKEFIKKYIDQLAKYKMNVFHWHLTDDQGWRIEIKNLPELTEIGAWRAARMGKWWTRDPQYNGEAASYGGFYTQEDVKDIVEYASKRYVTVLPEIDVPGHSMAALAAYPELSCTGGNFRVNVGNKFYTLEDNALCAGNESSYLFMDKVISEVAELFPGQYIHIGGDECYKGFWADCEKCIKKMKDENLKSTDELQSYFIKRMEKIVKAKGKKLMGWDEILEGGLAPEAAVMSWRGMEGGTAAAKMNHHVVMSPESHCYLDLYQGDPVVEPPTYSMLRLKTSYDLEVVPEGVNPQLILGGQGNLWTESVPTSRHAEYMTWPRAFALAETFWSQKDAKNWDDFVSRVERNFKRFDIAGVNYATSMYDPIIKSVKMPWPGTIKIDLSSEVNNLDIYYTFDGSYPDMSSSKYGSQLAIPRGSDLFRAISYRDNKPIGKMISISIQELEQRK